MTPGMNLQRPDNAGRPALPQTRTHATLDDHLGGTVPLREYLDAIRRYAWVVVAALVGTIGLAAYQVSREAPRYHASASVRLVDQRPAIAGNLADTWNERSMGGWTDPIRTQIEVLKSRSVVAEVVEQSGFRLRSLTPELRMNFIRDVAVGPREQADTIEIRFHDDAIRISGGDTPVEAAYGQPVDIDGVRFTVDRRPPVNEARLVALPAQAAIEEVTTGLAVAPREYTTIIDIGFQGYDPDVAMRVVNAAAQVFERTSTTTTQQQSARRRQFITEQLRLTDSILAQSEDRLTGFRQEQGGARPPVLTDGLETSRRQRRELQAELELYRRLLDGLNSTEGAQRVYGILTSPELRQNVALAGLAGDMLRLSAQRDSLTKGIVARTSRHPEVQRLDTLLEATRHRFASAVQGHETVLTARMSVLDRELARGTTDLARAPSDEIEQGRLAREVETVRKLSDKLREELQAAQIAEAVEVGDVQVIDLAPFGEGPLGGGRNRKLLFGALLGLMFGGFAAIGLDRINTSIRDREEIERVLRLPELATIPQLTPAEGASRRGYLARFRAPARTPAVRDLGVAPLGSISAYGAESYRKLMANLIFTPNAESLKTLVVTSPLASEGKTTTATHLAIAFAQHGRRVLLVDADLRRGRLHQIFRVAQQPGLTEIITGDVAVKDAFCATSNPNLTVLPTGAPPINPLEFLGSARMKSFLEGAAELFDVIIIDTAPVLLAADAVALAVEAGGVLLVIRAGSTQRSHARQAKQQLETVGARILGAVLNDADSQLSGYSRYGGYGYGGYYTSREEATEVPVAATDA